MKILNPEEVKRLDSLSIEQQSLGAYDLIQRSARAATSWIHKNLDLTKNKIEIYCGVGDNGADGLALAALLQEEGYNVKVVVVDFSANKSNGFVHYWNRIKERPVELVILNEESGYTPQEADVIIDAILGVGLNKPLAEWLIDLVTSINGSDALVLSLDIPSGMPSNQEPYDFEGIVMADIVLTFGLPKLSFFLPKTGQFIPLWEVLDIGYEADLISAISSNYEWVRAREIKSMIQSRPKFAHKGDFGHIQVIGGSKGKIGAPILTTRGAFEAGAGLVSVSLPQCGAISMHTSVPEAMLAEELGQDFIVDFNILEQADVIVAGMGLGMNAQTELGLGAALSEHPDKKWVLDADALNLIAKNRDWIPEIPKGAVMTPHEGELRRLVGSWDNDFEKIKKAQDFAARTRCVLVLKGAYTLIFYGTKVWINSTGNSGMAVAGSGDLLSGIIGGLSGQGYTPVEAAILGVYLHGAAGDWVKATEDELTVTPTKMIMALGKALANLK